MKNHLLIAFAFLISGFAMNAKAVEFKSVGVSPAIAYEAPARKSRKIFVVPRGTPVEVIMNYENWIKVRDAAGDLFWLESDALVSQRHLVVISPKAQVYLKPNEKSTTVFTAAKGVLLNWTGSTPNTVIGSWTKVRHRDGQSGYIQATDVWGE